MEDTTKDVVKTWYQNISFSWYDYTLFSVMLSASAMIGIYFGCFGNKQSTAKDYLLGGKTMKVFPIAMSLVASHVSSVTLLAVPADVYKHGSMYWLSCIAIIFVCIITCCIYLPVFYKLQLTSTYEYLKLRFDTRVRLLTSFLGILTAVLYMPLVIYVPALAFSQATGVNPFYIALLVMAICIFYTTIGGLKAVVWTDTLQFSITIIAITVVFFLGLKSAGGIGAVFDIAASGDRLSFDFDLDPTKRETVLALLVGWTINYVKMVSMNQDCIQKFLSLPSLEKAYLSVALFGIGLIFVKTACVVTGLIIYAKYAGCDPFKAGFVEKPDQLLPYYVMDVASSLPGLPGLFVAGIFCAALSTMSAVMNSLSGNIYEDFLARHMPKDIKQETVGFILKLIVVIIGVTCTSLVLVVQHLGGILPLAISIVGVASGTSLGLFTLGMVFPKANAKGAFYGSLISLAVVFWIAFGAQYYKAKGALHYPSKPTSIHECPFEILPKTNLNSTIIEEPVEVFFVYRISYYYYSFIGAVICIIAGLIISYFTGKDDLPVDKDLLTPAIYPLLNEKTYPGKRKSYYTVEKALQIVVTTE